MLLQINMILLSLLNDIIEANGSFKDAVFISELINKDNNISTETNDLLILCKAYDKSIAGVKYHWRDSINHRKNLSINAILKDTVYIELDSLKFIHTPFRFNFTDPFGKQDYTNTFVTKLLATPVA